MSLLFFCFLVACVIGNNLDWSWDKVNLWANFGGFTSLSDYESEFLATHYDVISIEKCTGWPTEQNFYTIASDIRKYSHSTDYKNPKILFYFNAGICYDVCYSITNTVLKNESMWFHDDDGVAVEVATDRPFYDMTQEYVRKWWVQALVSIIKGALDQNIMVDGVFVDRLCTNFGSTVSTARQTEYNNAIVLLMNETRNAFDELDKDLFILGNGIISYGFQPDHCVGAVPYIDGVLVEHFGSHDDVNSDGTIKTDHLLMWFDLTQSIMNGDYGDNKSIFIKAWVGPYTGSWSDSYDRTYPTTNEAIQNASRELITFPLALYLCGIYRENTYFSYGWKWDLRDYVPCPDNPQYCHCPLNWYSEFSNKLGEPLSDAIMTDTYKCNRSFQYANVYVDLEDDESAIIEWLTDSPTADPTVSPITTSPTTPSPTTETLEPTLSPTVNPTLSLTVKEIEDMHKVGAVIVAMFLIAVLIVTACVGYSTWKYVQMETNVQGINAKYQAMQ